MAPSPVRRFPLVEVLIVIAVIVILVSIVITMHFHLLQGGPRGLKLADYSEGQLTILRASLGHLARSL